MFIVLNLNYYGGVRKKFVVAVLALLLTHLSVDVSRAEENIDRWAPEQQYNSPKWPGPGYIGFGATYSGNYLTPNYLLALSNKAINACPSMKDAKCNDKDIYTISTGLTLPTCKTDDQIDCLSKFEAFSREGTKLEITNLGEFKTFDEFGFVGNSDASLPNPGTPTIYQIPGAPHPGGDKYIVVPYYQSQTGLTSDVYYVANFNVNQAARGFRLMIFAITIYDGEFDKKELIDDPSRYAYGSRTSIQIKNNNQCIYSNSTQCLVARAIPDNVRFSLGLRTSFALSNHIFGRVSEVEVVTGRDKQGNHLLEISGFAQKVPMFGKWMKKNELPKELVEFYAKRVGKMDGWGASKEEQLQPGENWSLFRNSGQTWIDGLEEIQLWLKIIDKASLTPSSWSLEFQMQQGTGSLASFSPGRCYYPEPSLIVTTNASDFLSTSPTFDEKTQEIVYTVAAPHLLPNGEVFAGSYELIIRSDTARCLYNFSSAPLKASIQVTSADNKEQIAVTNMVEKNGWIYLTARGFTFSTPKLKVSLFQEQVAVAPKVETPKKSKTVVTLTCAKGKKTRYVEGTKPKCPKGYKKVV